MSEDILQDLIAKYPNLLAGYEMDENEPRKWLLVQREQVLPYDNTGLKLFYLIIYFWTRTVFQQSLKQKEVVTVDSDGKLLHRCWIMHQMHLFIFQLKK